MNHSSKVSASYRADGRLAVVVYVRQSTVAQTHVNTESLERQYELVSRAVDLGWERSGVKVIDEDLGRSGADASRRTGFQALVADVGLGRVGLVLGIEGSRLARRNADWYQLLDLCAVTGTLIGDGDGIYDPADYSDRLVLGPERDDERSRAAPAARPLGCGGPPQGGRGGGALGVAGRLRLRPRRPCRAQRRRGGA